MRIEEIKIKNFRQYKNITFDFRNTEKNDLHVILGKNGMGKTNLLNAITWCIYNQEFHLGNTENALERANVNAIKEAKLNGEKEIKVEVSVTISNNTETITYYRVEPFNIKMKFTKKSEFSIFCKDRLGKTKKYTEKEMIEPIINTNLPESIKDYFFFDGEQLDNYFRNSNGALIKDAIYNISQVKLLTDANYRLGRVINDLESHAASDNKELSELTELKDELNRHNEQLQSDINILDKQVRESKIKISECSDYLKSSEGVPEKENELENISDEIQEKNREINNINNEFKIFIKKYTILFAYYDCNKKTLDIIRKKEKEGLLPPDIDKSLLKRMLLEHKCLICESELDREKEKHVEQILEKLQVSSELSNLLSKIKGTLENNLNEIKKYPNDKEKIFYKKKKLEEELRILNNKANEIDKYLKNFTDREEIRKKHIEREKHQNLVDQNLMKIGSYKHSLEENEKKLENIQKKINLIIKKEKQLEKIRKQIEFAKRSKCIIESIELEMMNEVKEKMTKKTMEYFNQLIWKKNTYERIELDENYTLELYHKDGYPSVGSCSAAERALLALSFTLALQEVSGYNSMLFIDTPVGRVDSENREKFANRLAEISKDKQIIMTFTTSEYSKEIEGIFDPIISGKYILETENEKETYLI